MKLIQCAAAIILAMFPASWKHGPSFEILLGDINLVAKQSIKNLGCEPYNRPCFWSSPTALYSQRKDSAPHPFRLSFEWCLLQNWYLKKVNLLGKLSARWKSLLFTIQCTVTGFSWWNLLFHLSVGNWIDRRTKWPDIQEKSIRV